MLPIETERLILRQLTPADALGMFELDSDPLVSKYLHQKPFTSIDQAREVIDYILQQYHDYGIARWAVIEKETNQFIGWSGLKLITEPINNHINFYDIGYRLISRFWGKGYATESARPALQYGFDVLQANTIYGMCAVENTASANVLQKIGLQYVEDFGHRGIPHKWFKIAK
ncbi:GNAT family N-acetyltransferase [Mucilaginibacter ximonensis]|uniref:GNAT family N-acetyltransferase n=1 Tax=Mucilaginibacter ximonensis TaxID=538021 RepID=A0ABW5Y6L0_9SPHI